MATFNTHALPQALMPAYNPIMFKVSSANQDNLGFEFLFSLYESNTSNRVVPQVPVQVIDGFGVFDAHRFLESYVSYDLDPMRTGITTAPNSRYFYDVQIGEQYNYIYSGKSTFNYAGAVGFSSHTTDHYYSVGDRVVIAMNGGGTYPQYNGIHTVTVVPNSRSFVIETAFGGLTTGETSTSYFADYRKTAFNNLYSTSGLCVNNAALSHLDYRTFHYSGYNTSPGMTSARFWTDMPINTWETRMDSRMWVNGFTQSANTVHELVVVATDDNGDIRQVSLSGNPSAKYFQMGVGPWNLNHATVYSSCTFQDAYQLTAVTTVNSQAIFYIAASGQTFNVGSNFSYVVDDGSPLGMANTGSGQFLGLTGVSQYGTNVPAPTPASAIVSGTVLIDRVVLTSVTTTVITDNTKHYDFHLRAYPVSVASAVTASTSYRVIMDRTPSKYTDVQLIALCRKGSFIPFTFSLKSTERVNISRQEYKKRIGGYNGNTWTYNTYDRGRTVFNTDFNRRFKAVSNFITNDANVEFWEQLYTSNEVYWLRDGVLLPVIIISNDFEPKNMQNDKLFNYEIEFELAFNDEVQRG